MSAAMSKKMIGGNEWTVVSVNGTVSISAELQNDALAAMETTIGLAVALGVTTDVCADFSAAGFSCLTFQFDAIRLDTIDALLSLLVA